MIFDAFKVSWLDQNEWNDDYREQLLVVPHNTNVERLVKAAYPHAINIRAERVYANDSD